MAKQESPKNVDPKSLTDLELLGELVAWKDTQAQANQNITVLMIEFDRRKSFEKAVKEKAEKQEGK